MKTIFKCGARFDGKGVDKKPISKKSEVKKKKNQFLVPEKKSENIIPVMDDNDLFGKVLSGNVIIEVKDDKTFEESFEKKYDNSEVE